MQRVRRSEEFSAPGTPFASAHESLLPFFLPPIARARVPALYRGLRQSARRDTKSKKRVWFVLQSPYLKR